MLRLIGILIGSALAIGLLIVTLGVPQFSNPAPEPERLGGDLPATAPEPAPAAVDGDLPATEPEAVAGDVPAAEPDTEALIDQIFSPDAQAALAGEPEPEPEPESEPDLDTAMEENWYAFWSPFRSELAANGFVSKLQETTGIDYRVVKVKTGVYEVAFAYTDDADVQDKLSRISAATGLDMSGG